MSESNDAVGSVDFAKVVESELAAIVTRRERAGYEKSPPAATNETAIEKTTPAEPVASSNLIGLALSGGGVRSAAVCLGALQGLHRKGVLRFIDYLSTVSGGGYAGAYLSSTALQPEPSGRDAEAATPGQLPPKEPALNRRLDAALGTGGPQPQRVRELIGNGGFLLRNKLAGVNRTFFGMLLIWAFVGSGLVALTSLVSYLYRSLDAVECRQFLAVLGIGDQLSLDLFPPFVMLLIYVLIWSISYWRDGRAAQGRLARWWLVAMIFVTAVAVAKLMGSGNITVDTVASLIGEEPSKWIRNLFENRLPTVIIGVVGASLLPYFSPAALFRSGGEGKAGASRLIFTAASWALLAGVPFLMIAYFSYEGIGRAHRLADHRLRISQVKDWRTDTFPPLWQSLRGEYLKSKSQPGSTDPSTSPTVSSLELKNSRRLAKIWTWVNFGKFDQRIGLDQSGGLAQLWKLMNNGTLNDVAPSDPDDAALFTRLDVLHGRLARYEMSKSVPLERVIPDGAWSWPSTNIGILTRWYHLIEYCCGYSFGLDAIDEYNFALISQTHRDIHDEKERIVFRLNQLLLRPDFYQFFPDGELTTPPVGLNLNAQQEKDWLGAVYRRRAEAAALQKLVRQNASPSAPKNKSTESAKPSWLRNISINASSDDTPWLFELRPRWSLIPSNVSKERSTPREKLFGQRIREEQSYYPDEDYIVRSATSAEERERKRQSRIFAEEEFSPILDLPLRTRLVAGQTDSYYVVKPWKRVQNHSSLKEFADDKDITPEVEWFPLLTQAWNELPGQRSAPTTLRDVKRGWQSALTTDAESMRRMLAANRALLEAYFSGTIDSPGKVFSYMVLERDQQVRWAWFCWSLGCCLILGLILDLNATSWHGFYAERIADAWIEPAAGLEQKIPLAQLRTTDEGLPYHLMSGSLSPFRNPFLQQPYHLASTDLFLFSQQFVGSEGTGYRATGDLDDDNYNLSSVAAISGGAVNPMHAENPLQRALLLLGNVRLGQWIRNPAYRNSGWRLWESFLDTWPITPFRFFAAMLFRPEGRKYCFVTDGGLTENLGIKQLLLRRCKLILAIDAGQDENFEFHDLSKLLRWMQVEQGIRITWQRLPDNWGERSGKFGSRPELLMPLVPTQIQDRLTGGRDKSSGVRPTADAVQHHLLARIEYAGYATASENDREQFVGYLVYMKSTLCQSDPVELVNYKWAHPQFPHDPTSDLAFNRDQFESYRHLGQYTAETALNSILKVASPSSLDKSSQRIESPSQFIDFVRLASESRVDKPVSATLALPPASPPQKPTDSERSSSESPSPLPAAKPNSSSATNGGLDSDSKATDTEKDKTQSGPHSKKAGEEPQIHAKTPRKSRTRTQPKENTNPHEPLDGAKSESAEPTTATLSTASIGDEAPSADSIAELQKKIQRVLDILEPGLSGRQPPDSPPQNPEQPR